MRSERLLSVAVAGLVLFGLSCGSNNDNGPTAPQEAPPRAPSDLQVTATAPSQITILWRDNTSDETGFRIERSIGGPGTFAQRDTVARNLTAYTDAQIEQGQTYYYRVRSYVRGNVSEPSEQVWAIAVTNATPSVPVALSPPDRANEIEAGTVQLRWASTDPDAGDEIRYDVSFGVIRNDMRLIAQGITETELTVTDPVVLNAHYFWQVKAHDTKGAMAVGPVWGFNTRVERIAIPEGYLVMGDRTEFIHPGNPILVRAFEIDRFEVSNQQYADFLNDALRAKPPQIRTTGGAVYDPGGTTVYAETAERDADAQITYDRVDSLFTVVPGKEAFPVIEVSWFGADAFARFYGRRLPAEVEWEMAAKGNSSEAGDSLFTIVLNDSTTQELRVGLGRTYPWGESPDASRANFLGSGDPFESQPRVPTTPVGFYNGEARGGFQTQDGSTPGFGVHDLAGNVWEWCDDWYGVYTNPHNPPSDGTLKVIRGGGWNKGSGSMQTWRRSIAFPDERGSDSAIGFRTVRSVSP